MLQLKHLQLVDECAYKPLKDITIGGIILFCHTNDSEEEEKEELVEPVAGKKISSRMLAFEFIFYESISAREMPFKPFRLYTKVSR